MAVESKFQKPVDRLWLFAIIWGLAVMVGSAQLIRYEFAEGEAGDHPRMWPVESQLQRAGDRPTLLFFSHPYCPCTRASLGELAVLLADVGDRVDARFVLLDYQLKPEEAGTDALRGIAARLPGLQLREDPDGREAGLFGARTSGHVLLYDPAGRLLFAGGITESRGHEGANRGRSILTSLIERRPVDASRTPVFGCPLKE